MLSFLTKMTFLMSLTDLKGEQQSFQKCVCMYINVDMYWCVNVDLFEKEMLKLWSKQNM